MLISVVIPCYKSAATVGGVVDELSAALSLRSVDYEIILVNDGSPDGGATIARLRDIAAADRHVVVVNLARNFGQHRAIMAGFHQVRGDVVVVLDDDGQTPGDQIYRLVDKIAEGHDIVYARYPQKKHSAYRNLGSRFNAWCNHRFMGIPKDLWATSYFACRRFVVDHAVKYENPYPYVDGLLFEATRSYATVDMEHRSREAGSSGYSLRRLLSLWLDGFTAFSVKPLRVATIVGSLLALCGFIGIVMLVLGRLFERITVEGWTSLMVLVLFIGGLTMLMLGLVGEYVGRIYLSLNNKPQFVVRETFDRRGDAGRAE